MSVNKSRPNERCSICGKTLTAHDRWGNVRSEPSKEGLCKHCYAKRGRDKLHGRDPYRRRKR